MAARRDLAARSTKARVIRMLRAEHPDGLTTAQLAMRLRARQDTLLSTLSRLRKTGNVRSEQDGRERTWFATDED